MCGMHDTMMPTDISMQDQIMAFCAFITGLLVGLPLDVLGGLTCQVL